MSRTYRRQSGRRWWLNLDPNWDYYRDTWWFESDCPGIAWRHDGPLKDESKVVRRRQERKLLRRVFTHDEDFSWTEKTLKALYWYHH